MSIRVHDLKANFSTTQITNVTKMLGDVHCKSIKGNGKKVTAILPNKQVPLSYLHNLQARCQTAAGCQIGFSIKPIVDGLMIVITR